MKKNYITIGIHLCRLLPGNPGLLADSLDAGMSEWRVVKMNKKCKNENKWMNHIDKRMIPVVKLG